MRTPLTYYGGKTNLLNHIIPNLPTDHSAFVEPFGGSLAVLLAKEPAKNEIVNDHDSALMNFFSVITTDFDELKHRIDQTPYSRIAWKVARTMHDYPQWFDRIQRAWAYFVLSNQSFSGNIASWGPYRKGCRAGSYEAKKETISVALRNRLSKVQMECKNAVDLIKQADSEDTLVYADPPYFNSVCKPYVGTYSEHDFRELLETLASMKGRFLLSSYPSDLLDLFAKNYGWHQKAIVQPISVNRTKTGKNRKKVEVLTANYPLQ